MAQPLDKINAHPRDAELEFDEPTHVYTISDDSGYTSVTTWIHQHAPHFDADKIIGKMRKSKKWGPDNKYYGLTDQEIKDGWAANGKEAAELGTEMHLNIEYYYNNIPYNPGFTETREFKLFKSYLKDHKEYKPYRTEWAVYSKKYRLAGSIDMVYNDPKDPKKKIIADWKRCKDIKLANNWEKCYPPLQDYDNCNGVMYKFQLNVYRMILEKYYGLKISEMFLVVLHPNQDDYIKIPVEKFSKPIMKMLAKRKKELEK